MDKTPTPASATLTSEDLAHTDTPEATNGAEHLVQSLADAGIDMCFANPGTSEMHFVAALDRIGGIRCVLALFEGVVAGAADGYARMAGKPALTLLHLGPGFGNAIANLHNARKALTSVVNIVGDHTHAHINKDAPLTADIEGLAAPVSHWIKTCQSADYLAADGRSAVEASREYPGKLATLILPANTAWQIPGDKTEPARADVTPTRPQHPNIVADDRPLTDRIAAAVLALNSAQETAIILGGPCLINDHLLDAGRIAALTGATLLTETSNARIERGHGRVNPRAIPYVIDRAIETLAPFRHLILLGAKPPVGFFAYPDKPSELHAPGTHIHHLATPQEDAVNALMQLCQAVGAAQSSPVLTDASKPEQATPTAPLTAQSIAAVIAHWLPADTIVVDESITTGRDIPQATAGAAPHDWLQICGGSIGDGMPLATGAALACPERQVLTLQADGSGMYTLQALWTQARERLNIITLVLANRSYEILKAELNNVQAQSGPVANNMMSLDNPTLDWVSLAKGMGVDASAVHTAGELTQALAIAQQTEGPFLIEAVLETGYP